MDRHAVRVPTTPGEWALWLWAVGGVMGFITQALVRLSPRALSIFTDELTAFQWAIAIGWTAFMLYTEAWRGFHLRFSPRVVARANGLLDRVTWGRALLAPAISMGLLYATPVRMWVSRIIVLMIICLVVVVRQLPDPWRGIVDLGVVVGLAAGTLSIAWFACRTLQGHPMPVAPDFPEEHAA